MTKEELNALKDSVITVGQWISNETQSRKYQSDEVMKLSNALINLKCYFDDLEAE